MILISAIMRVVGFGRRRPGLVLLVCAAVMLTGCMDTATCPSCQDEDAVVIVAIAENGGDGAVGDEYAGLLATVLAAGDRVDYRQVAESRELLERYVAATWRGWGQTSLADQINVFNALVLRALCEIYPAETLGEAAYRLEEQIVFEGISQEGPIALGTLRQLIAEYSDDWRTPFALTRPTLAGPLLIGELYTTDMLDTQLDDAFLRYACSCGGIRVDHDAKRVLLSPLLLARQETLLAEYPTLFEKRYAPQEEVSLITALIPHVCPKTQRLLVNTFNYGVGELPLDERINDVVRQSWYKKPGERLRAPKYLSFPCGQK